VVSNAIIDLDLREMVAKINNTTMSMSQ